MQKLLLVDAMSLIFRAYYATERMRLMTTTGIPTGAINTFINLISSIIDKEIYDFIAVAFDCREKTFRHNLCDSYKANRVAFPEDLEIQLPYIKEYLKLVGIPCVEKPGFEADDIVGTFARQASADNLDVTCITSDKDFFQLINKSTSIKRVKNNNIIEVVNKSNIKNIFGVEAEQVIDYLALTGDASDNIPGVKGIGEKTAIPLLEEYRSLENIYKNIERITSKRVQKLLMDGRESAFLSKTLVTIKTDVELGLEYKELKRKNPDFIKLDNLFKTLELNKLREKIKNNIHCANHKNEPIVESNNYSVATVPEYIFLTNSNSDIIFNKLANSNLLSMEVVSDAEDVAFAGIVGISIAVSDYLAYYIELSDFIDNESELNLFGNKEEESLTYLNIISKLTTILQEKNKIVVGYNLNKVLRLLGKLGISVNCKLFDISIASFLLSEDKRKIQALSQTYLGYEMIDLTHLNVKVTNGGYFDYTSIDREKLKYYYCEYADCCFRLYNKLLPMMVEQNLYDYAEKVDFPLISVLSNMEKEGVLINTDILSDISHKLGIEIDKIKLEIYKQSGEEFNIDSPKQLGIILYEKLGLPPNKKNKTGYSTDVKTLLELRYFSGIIDYILKYRQYTKLKTTYADSLPKLVNKDTGRLHTTFHQDITATGRLSSTNPNIQNIPIRNELGRELREAFIAEKGHSILSADYSQIELRVMAYVSGDVNMIKAFKNKEDIHNTTASLLFGINDVTNDHRRIAKTVNFGILYGLGAFGLSQRLEISRKEASEIINNYFTKFYGVKSYIDRTLNNIRENGYAETLLGRKRKFLDINDRNHNIRMAAERAAINMPIQGTAADLIKLAMISIYNDFKNNKLKSRMLIQVHDELVFEVANDEIEIIKSIVKNRMENAISLGDVPLVVDIGIGTNWSTAHS